MSARDLASEAAAVRDDNSEFAHAHASRDAEVIVDAIGALTTAVLALVAATEESR